MRTAARAVRLLALGALVVVLVAAGLVGGIVAAITVGGHPPLAGRVTIAGLDGEVRITRDAAGVARVEATTPHDLFLAQGWLHASERIWQMEIWRRIGAGRLAELFGPSQVATDRFIRTLDWRGAAERDLAVASPEALAVLEAYSDGVNAFVDGREGSLGLAFTVAGALSGTGSGIDGFRPEPWTPLDTLTWAKVQAWNLGGNLDSELFRLLADARLGDPAITDELYPAYDPGRPVIASEAGTGAALPAAGDAATASAGGAIAADLEPWLALARTAGSIAALAGLAPAGDLAGGSGVGSNNWVVAPGRSATGGALLANDPHLGLALPSVWYVNGLHCRPVSDACPWDVAGVSFPGTPGVVAGRNARIAWGVTNAGPDVQDLVEERVDPADPGRYLTADGSLPFERRTETIRVAGRDDVVIEVRSTIHGPILNDVEERLADADALYALRWTALQVPDRILDVFLGINLAGDWEAFRAALRGYGAPAQNFVYADVDGHIGYQLPGAIPVRGDPGDLGLRPVPGWDGEHEWVSFVPFDELPTVLDPPSGRIVTANNAIDGRGAFIGVEFDRGDRAARIVELLDAAPAVGLDTMAAIQGDTVVLRGRRLAAAIRELAPVPSTGDGTAVLDALLGWDGSCPTGSVGCTAFATYELALQRAILDDDLGPLAREYVGSDAAEGLVDLLLGTEAGRRSAWWGDRLRGGGATAGEVAAAALDEAGALLRRDLGDPAGWTWGRVHTITFREATLGVSGIGPLEWYFGSATSAVAGASGAVNNVYYRLSRAYGDDTTAGTTEPLGEVFAVTNGPSMRALYDLGDPDGARIVSTTGQSGAPFSRHGTDWIARWLANETVAFPFGPSAEAGIAGELLLVPEG